MTVKLEQVKEPVLLEHSKKSMFNEKGYVVKKGFFSKDTMELVMKYYETSILNGQIDTDAPRGQGGQCPGTFKEYGGLMGDSILDKTLLQAEKIFGEELSPCYSYFRLYNRNDCLEPHTDRPSCELSATLNIYSDTPWPIFMQKYDFEKNGFGEEDKLRASQEGESDSLILNQGDICFYEGTLLNHWRKPFDGDNCYQLFIHYVRKNGEYKDNKFDGREQLGAPPSNLGGDPYYKVHNDFFDY